jgi:hypothetical protein
MFAAALAAALAGCNGEGGSIDYSNDNTYKDPLKNPAPAGCTVSWQTGNGAGLPPQSQLITKQDITDGTNKITLPDEEGLEAPDAAMVFVGWNDGMLTYPAEYEYTVTKNVTFKARWAFTTLDKITTHLNNAGTDAPVLIAVSGGVPKNGEDTTSLTWRNLLVAIKTAGEAGKFIELDLTGSTLALFGDASNEFDYTDGGAAYNTGEKYITKLVLPSAATSIKTNFNKDYFSSLETVSGLKVGAIPDNAFNGLKTLAALAFPAAESIGRYAFYNCYSLTEVSLTAAESIGQYAFCNCYSLTEVSLPAAKTIEGSAFYNCFNLTSVSLPVAETIGSSIFQFCTSLTSVNLPEAKTIEGAAFQYCASLTEVNLPAATSIGGSAFGYCYGLTSVSLNAMETISSGVFQYCTSLTSVSLNAAKTINDSVFGYCTSLTSVSLPAAETIGSSIFQFCTSLTKVNLPVAKDIYGSAFTNCVNLTSITIAAGCNINNDPIRGGFKTYYNGTDGHTEKAAGSYTYNSVTSSWSYKEL